MSTTSNKLLSADIRMKDGSYNLTILNKFTEPPYTEINFRTDVDNKIFETKNQLLTYLKEKL